MRRWGCSKAAGRAASGLTACAVTAFMVAAPAGAAVAAHQLWRIQNSQNATVPGGQLQSVSCSSAAACTAVGTSISASGLNVTLAERWNGSSWQRQLMPKLAGKTVPGNPAATLSVSCPVSGFCEAVGTYQVDLTGITLAEGWNGSAWTRQRFPAPAGSTSTVLGQLSCTSAKFCEAVGSYTNSAQETLGFAAQWNGTSWRLQHSPDPVGATDVRPIGVSCVSPTFCEGTASTFGSISGGGPFADQWNGTRWHLQALPANTGVGPVSCASVAFCEMVSSGGAVMWNGSAWNAQTMPSPAGSTFSSLSGVSCASASFCEAVGEYSNSSGTDFGLGVTWNGTSWAVQTTPHPPDASSTGLDAVSCAAVTACEAGGDFQLSTSSAALPLAEAWNGTSWQLQHAVAPREAASNSLNAVSCVSSARCEAVGSHLDASGLTVALAELWNGVTWKIQKTPNPAQATNGIRMVLNGVSCVSAAFCAAVGSSSSTAGGGAEIWNGTSWALQSVPGGSLTSVSCTSASFCVAAGADGHVDLWNGTSWSAQSTAAGFTSLSSVSCPSPTSCEAAGSGPSGDGAEGWNGTSWSPQAVPAPSDGSSPALSAVSCTGAQSCEAVGSYTSGTTFLPVPLAEVWNGTAWAAQRIPAPAGAFISSLAGVWCTSANSCTAVGQYSPSTGPTATVAEVWNGTAWRLQSTPTHSYAGQSIFNGVSCGASNACSAVGVTTNPGQTPATLAETGD